MNVQNCIAMNCTVDDFRNVNSTWGAISNNMSSDYTAPGLDPVHDKAAVDQFINIGQGVEDLHLLLSSDARNAGTNLSAWFDNDIDGQSRGSTWDIGADEAGVEPPVPFGAYYEWTYKRDIAINTSPSGANIATNLQNFPLLVRLDAENFDFSQAKPDGSDIRFSKIDLETPLDYEIERWDPQNQVAEIWVKVDEITANSSDQHIVMYWDNAEAESFSNGKDVFNSTNGFAGVWHLNENGDSYRIDETNNHNHGTPHNGAAASHNGIIGKANSFDGLDDYISLPDMGKNNAATISVWHNYSGTGKQPLVTHESWADGYCHFKVENNQVMVSSYPWPNNLHGNSLTENTWNFSAYSMNGNGTGNWNYYENGSELDNGDFGQDSIVLPLFIGHEYTNRYFNGTIDEVRIETVARSSDWIKMCYENQRAAEQIIHYGEISSNSLKDKDGDFVCDLLESYFGTNIESTDDFPIIAVPDLPIILDQSQDQVVTYDFSKFYPDYSSRNSIEITIPANTIATNELVPIIQVTEEPEGVSGPPQMTGYSMHGRYFEISGNLMDGKTISMAFPFNDRKGFIPAKRLKVDHHTGSWGNELVIDKVTSEAIYAQVGSFSPFAIIEPEKQSAVAYVDGAILYEGETDAVSIVDYSITIYNPLQGQAFQPKAVLNFTDGTSFEVPMRLIDEREAIADDHEKLIVSGSWWISGGKTVQNVTFHSYERSYQFEINKTLGVGERLVMEGFWIDDTSPEKWYFINNIEPYNKGMSPAYHNIITPAGHEGRINKALSSSAEPRYYYVTDHLGST
ncbi:MAG: DUF2341 domain-containing protein, partial [Chitinivibrionales bacterium]|nr:DUF2341 domain-containing protein [Chitinivibrionales bacterium]